MTFGLINDTNSAETEVKDESAICDRAVYACNRGKRRRVLLLPILPSCCEGGLTSHITSRTKKQIIIAALSITCTTLYPC